VHYLLANNISLAQIRRYMKNQLYCIVDFLEFRSKSKGNNNNNNNKGKLINRRSCNYKAGRQFGTI
jgi:hypothetical protein